MTTRTDDRASPIIESREDLLSVFTGGEKQREAWRIGTEHEKFVYRMRRSPGAELGRAGRHPRPSDGLTEFGWEPVLEGGKIIALKGVDGNVSLEPAGQFELSGAPLENLHETCAEAARHLEQCKTIGDRLGLGFLGLGMWPDKTRADLPIMPKGRYGIMLNYMPKVGSLGLDMMLRTCTIQVNLDYSSEADMVKKFRVGLALQPVATALFANSPFTEGKPNGYQELPQPYLGRYRSRPHRHAAVRVRGWVRVRTLLRLHARCADVLRVSRRPVHRRSRRAASAISWTGACPSCRAKSRSSTTGPTICRPPSPKCG